MKNKFFAFLLVFLLVMAIVYLLIPNTAIDGARTKMSKTSEANGTFNYLPSSTTNQIIKHDNFALSYSEAHEQAEWVAYELKDQHLASSNRKRPLFELDKKVATKSAHWANYKNSGYSKGHLLPAADRKFSKAAYDNTFLTSNIAPQKPEFNAGIWNRLEQKVRYWASKERHLYVVTGGILQDDLETIGFEKVTVPKYFYKVILDYSEPQVKAIAFLIPHQESKKPLYDFVVTVDKIEALTGVDFFPNLSDELETVLERSSNYKNWSFN